MKYSFRKTISIINILVFLFAFVAIWIEQTETILISYGLIGAGIAVSLQDVFKNFAGGITIFSSGLFRVGDRIEINGKTGDVIDIGVLYTSIMEIGEWIGPLEMNSSYVFLKCIDRIPTKTRTFEQAKNEVEQTVRALLWDRIRQQEIEQLRVTETVNSFPEKLMTLHLKSTMEQ